MGSRKQPEPVEAGGFTISSVFGGAGGIPPAIIVGLLFFVAVVTVVVYGWRNWGRTVVARPIYRIAAESIEITPPPPWIRRDVRAEVVRDAALNDLTIFDKDATIRVYQAFELNPWVAKVQRVSKHPPARLIVDLEYRKPVAFVEVPPTTPTDEGGVIPIDGLTCVLPTGTGDFRDFTSEDLKHYLRISIRDIRPYGLAGTVWGDPRVTGAAKIATALDGAWQSLQLYRIQLASSSELSGNPMEPVYELETASHRRIVWGNAPGQEKPDEPSAPVKVNRLQQAAKSLGSLDQLPESGADLRDVSSLSVAARDSRVR